jgi:flagellar biosynthesis/type III secretory pathway protein FliH
MSGLIKAHFDPALSQIRSLDRGLLPVEITGVDARIIELEHELAERDAIIAELGKAGQEGFERGFAAGKTEGLASAETGVAGRLSLLEASVRDARASFESQLQAIEGLAALLARTSLDRIFLDNDGRMERVLAAIDRQLRDIDRRSVILVSVSRADFPDEAALDHLASQSPGLKIDARQDLKSGDCLFSLELGRIDAGLDQQWTAVRSVLTDIAGAEHSS